MCDRRADLSGRGDFGAKVATLWRLNGRSHNLVEYCHSIIAWEGELGAC